MKQMCNQVSMHFIITFKEVNALLFHSSLVVL